MGIYYEKQCYSDTGVTAVAEAGGYPELGPAMELAQAALDRSDWPLIGHHPLSRDNLYRPLLVTSVT